MNIEQARLAEPTYRALSKYLTVTALGLLLPFVLVALLPVCLMLLPVAVIAIPIIAPVMLGGRAAGRCERRATGLRASAAVHLGRTAARGAA